MAQDYRFARRALHTVANGHGVPAGMIRLGGGLGFPDELPDIAAEALRAARMPFEGLQYGPLFGLDDLRDAIVAYLAEDGVASTRDNILVVNGAKQGLDLACRVFMEPGDTIIVTAPTYLTAIAILKTHEVNFLTVPMDGDGMIVDVLADRLATLRRSGAALPKLLFDVPDFHNPTGVTLSAERRRQMVELAQEYGFRILEDDPYRRIRFSGEPVLPIKSFDPDDRVIGLGTVSKILAPGLRVGWVNAGTEIVRRMAAQKSDFGSNPFVQRIVAELFAAGKVGAHIAVLRDTLRVHRDVMVDSLARHLPAARVAVPQGGYFLWVELPMAMNGEALTRAATRRGVEIFAGQSSFAGPPASNYIRLAYSYCPPEEIRCGVERLGAAYRELGG